MPMLTVMVMVMMRMSVMVMPLHNNNRQALQRGGGLNVAGGVGVGTMGLDHRRSLLVEVRD